MSNTKEYRVNGRLHREDGPAVEWHDGTNEWRINGARHREDGPAVEWHDGTNEWFHYGDRHRIDGPAVEDESYHYYEWWVRGQRYYFPDGFQEAAGISDQEMAILILKYGMSSNG